MKIIVVDDEIHILNLMEKRLTSLLPKADMSFFSKPREAIEYAQSTKVDIAFLDINMRFMDGLTVAKELKELNPKLNIIFCTGYSEFSLEAHDLFCSGYLMKPVTEEKLKTVLSNLRYPIEEDNTLLTIRLNGVREVYDSNGILLSFKRKKAQAILFILAEQNGEVMSPSDISDKLWADKEDNDWDEKNRDYFYKLIGELVRVLKENNAEQVLKKVYNGYSLDMSLITVKES